MTPLAQRLCSTLSDSGLIRPDDRILVAVSGGLDSISLLHLLCEAATEMRLQLSVAHVNHSLRGTASDRDLVFVRTEAKSARLPFFSRVVDVRSLHNRGGGSLEGLARTARYAALEEMRLESGARAIATAHHLDDQVETVLMRAARGASVRGLAGIPAERRTPPVVRPLLDISRSELASYAAAHRLAFREDASNRDQRFTRNRIRHSVIPRLPESLLRQIPGFAVTSRAFWTHLDRFLRTYLSASDAFEHDIRTTEERVLRVVHVPHLLVLTPFVRIAAISNLFETTGIPQTRERLLQAEKLLHARPGSRIEFHSPGVSIIKDRTNLVIRSDARSPREGTRSLSRGRVISFASRRLLTLGPLPVPQSVGKSKSEAWIDADRISGTLRIRYWKAGDRFVPFGMRGSKRVGDFLRDEKVPVHLKDSVPVVVNKERIVWVCGYRPDDRFKITRRTRRVLQLSLL